MAEYIEREALREAFIKHFDAVYDDGKLVFSDHICTAEDCEDILKLVAELPTADVVPVVRCKDCKYCRKPKGKERYAYFEGVLLCESYEMNDSDVCAVNPDDYCSYGERRCSDESGTY
jgi:hypothetical protein